MASSASTGRSSTIKIRMGSLISNFLFTIPNPDAG
jgi:hypothetical protein